ncbi:signal peptidase II [Thermoproteota archaeon]
MIVIVVILIVALDQLSKIFISNTLTLNQSFPVIRDFFHVTLVHNTGIAFGMLKGNSTIILIVTIVGLAIIAYSLRKDLLANHCLSDWKKIPAIDKLAMSLILGGAIANMIDRIRLGYVVDFLDFRIWPVFNIADSCITIGAFILIWKLIIPSKIKKI